jgi:hypothetical protein
VGSWARAPKGVLKRRLLRRLLTPFGRELCPQRWIFVVGCYNSGTTLLRDLLGRHPQITCLPSEGVRLADGLPRPEDVGWHRMWSQCVDVVRLDPRAADAEARAARIRRQWSLAVPGAATNVLEKSIANAARLPFLEAHFRPAWFVHLVRDGYAVSEGIRRKSEPRRFGHDEFGDRYPIGLCARQWRASLETAAADREQLQRFLEIRYEKLSAEPAATLAGITEFLELPPLPDTEWRGQFDVHGVRSGIRDMNADSHLRLTAADLDEVEEEAGETLAHYGYGRP